MKTFFKIAFALGNFFWGAFVGFKIYNWYAPETGLELPVLTYLNIVVISFVVNTLLHSTERSLKSEFVFDATADDDKKGGSFIAIITIYYGMALFMAWLFKLILF